MATAATGGGAGTGTTGWMRRAILPAAILAAAAAGLAFPEAGGRMSRSAAVDLLVPLVMFLVSLRVRGEELARTLRRPFPVLASSVLIFGVFPPLAWLAQTLVGPSGDDGYAAMMILAAQPSTLATAAVLTGVAGGDVALAMLCTVTSQVVSVAATPWVLSAWVGSAVAVDAGALMGRLGLAVLLPVLAGQLVRRFVRGWIDRWSRRLAVAAETVVVVFVFMGFAAAEPVLRGRPAMVGTAFAAVVLLHGVMLVIAAGVGAVLRLGGGGRMAFTLASSQKTLAAGILVWRTGFPENAVGPILVVLHHLAQLVIDSILAPWMSRIVVLGRRPFRLT